MLANESGDRQCQETKNLCAVIGGMREVGFGLVVSARQGLTRGFGAEAHKALNAESLNPGGP